MAVTKIAGTGASTSSSPYSGINWTTATNITSDNETSVASITASTFDNNVYGYMLKATNFGFEIPAEATILGITVSVRSKYATANFAWRYVNLVNIGATAKTPGTGVTTSYATYTMGGAADTWSATTLTPANVNNSAFGVNIGIQATGNNCDAFVAWVKVTIDYGIESDQSTGGATITPTGALTTVHTQVGYHIERKAGSGGTYAEIAVDSASPYQDDGPAGGFVNGTTYYYKMRQFTAGAYGDYSNEVSVAYTVSGDTYYQDTGDATVTPSGGAIKNTGKKAGQATVTPSDGMAKKTSKPMGGATVTPAGSALKATAKGVGTATIAAVGAMTRSLMKTMATGGATITPSGDTTRLGTYYRGTGSAHITPAGAVLKFTSKTMGQATIAPAGNANKGIYQAIGGATLTPSGTTTQTAVLSQTAGGATITPSGAMIRKVIKLTGQAVLTPAGVIARFISKGVGQATITPSGMANKGISLTIGDAVITPTGNANKGMGQITGQATLTPAGVIATTKNPDTPTETSFMSRIVKVFHAMRNNDTY